MKKTFKGFTLVECLVAMAILAIGCMLLGEIEMAVAKKNNANNFLNTSLANQMQYIENYTNSATLAIYYGNSDTSEPHKDPNLSSNKPPHAASVTANHNYVTVTKYKSDGTTLDTASQYSFPVDIYVMYSRDTNNEARTSVTINADGKRTSETANTSYGDVSKNIDDSFETKDGSNITGVSLRYKYILGHTAS